MYMFLDKKSVRVTLKTGLLFILLKFVCCRTYLSVLETLNTAFLFSDGYAIAGFQYFVTV